MPMREQAVHVLNHAKNYLLGRHMKVTVRDHQLSLAVSNYRKTLRQLEAYARADVEAMAGHSGLVSYTDLTSIYKEYAKVASRLAGQFHLTQRRVWEDFEHDTFPQMTAYTETWEHTLWKQEHGFNNSDYMGLTYKEVMHGQSHAALSINDLWPSDMDTLTAQSDFIVEGIRTASREAEMGNCETDPTRPRWARVPSGVNTCAFCAMLASRGFVYKTEETAGGLGNTYHPHCSCTPTPSWDGTPQLDGYDLKGYKKLYAAATSKLGDNLTGETRLHSLLANIRNSGSSIITDAITPTADDD